MKNVYQKTYILDKTNNFSDAQESDYLRIGLIQTPIFDSQAKGNPNDPTFQNVATTDVCKIESAKEYNISLQFQNIAPCFKFSKFIGIRHVLQESNSYQYFPPSFYDAPLPIDPANAAANAYAYSSDNEFYRFFRMHLSTQLITTGLIEKTVKFVWSDIMENPLRFFRYIFPISFAPNPFNALFPQQVIFTFSIDKVE